MIMFKGTNFLCVVAKGCPITVGHKMFGIDKFIPMAYPAVSTVYVPNGITILNTAVYIQCIDIWV